MKIKNKVLISLLSASFIVGAGIFIGCDGPFTKKVESGSSFGPQRIAGAEKSRSVKYIALDGKSHTLPEPAYIADAGYGVWICQSDGQKTQANKEYMEKHRVKFNPSEASNDNEYGFFVSCSAINSIEDGDGHSYTAPTLSMFNDTVFWAFPNATGASIGLKVELVGVLTLPVYQRGMESVEETLIVSKDKETHEQNLATLRKVLVVGDHIHEVSSQWVDENSRRVYPQFTVDRKALKVL
jgi:hypothetical protein